MPSPLATLDPLLVADGIWQVRDWLAQLEERAARGALKEGDLKRLRKVAKLFEADDKPSRQIPRRRAVRAISEWLARKSTNTGSLMAKLAQLDGAFASLVLNRADLNALRGETGTKRQREHTLAARLALRAGALGLKKVASPDAADIARARRVLRKATE